MRSDFYAIAQFPEVYHGQGISKAGFSGGEGAVTGQGRETAYSAKVAYNTATSCVFSALSAGDAKEDPKPPEIGSEEIQERYNAKTDSAMLHKKQ